MDTNTKVEMLVKEAETNAASNDFFHVCAARKRARNSVNLVSLVNKMKAEGFNHTKGEYVSVLRLLAQLAFGELDLDKKGKVRGLKNIRVTLQSLGAAACKQSNYLDGFTPRHKFGKLVPKPEVIKLPVQKAPKKAAEIDNSTLKLPVDINNKVVMVKIPRNISGEDMATLLTKLYA